MQSNLKSYLMKYPISNIRRNSALILSALVIINLSVSAVEKSVSSHIKNVTVFLKGAQVNRTATVAIPAGNSILKLTNLSPYIDGKSVQVAIPNSNITVLGVHHRHNDIDELKPTAKMKSLEDKLDKLNEKITTESIQLDVIDNELNFIKKNSDIKGYNNGLSLTNLKDISQYYNERNRKLQVEKMGIEKRMAELDKEKANLQKEIARQEKIEEDPMSEVVVEVNASAATNVVVNFSYYTANAGWFPSYDIRSESIAKPVQLTCKANIRQNTREAWNDVKLKISSLNPNLGNIPPKLQPYYLDYHIAPPRYNMNIDNLVEGIVLDTSNEPLVGTSINIVGTSIGTITDINGKFVLSIPSGGGMLNFSYIGMISQTHPIIPNQYMTVIMQENKNALDEVIVVGYGTTKDNTREESVNSALNMSFSKSEKSLTEKSKPLPVKQSRSQTSIEMEIMKPYTIPSDNKTVAVDMQRLNIPAQYEYVAIPKIDKDAFLMARITNWEQYQLLEGEANIFNGSQFVGKTILDTRSTSDTLSIALGRDKSIQINREKQKEFTKRRFLSSKKEETMAWKTIVRNNKNQPITLILVDQVPISTNSDIEVIYQQLSGGKFNQENGEVEWELQLTPSEKRDINLIYSVKYPKHRRLQVE